MPHLLTDWGFWAALVAALALILSQLPPVRVLIRPPRLSLHLHDSLEVTHWLGNDQVNLNVQLINDGGRVVRVRAMKLEVRGDDRTSLSLPARRLAREDGATGSFLFTPFRLEPDREWVSNVGFWNPLSAVDERLEKVLKKEMKAQIEAKSTARSPEEREAKKWVEADPALVAKFVDFFTAHNKWTACEYTATLSVDCDPPRASQRCSFRFTLYETDTQELKDRTGRYKFGFGVYLTDNSIEAVSPQVKDLKFNVKEAGA